MSVVTILMYVIFPTSLISGQILKFETNYGHWNKPKQYLNNIFETITTSTSQATADILLTENTFSTEASVETTTNINEAAMCLPGQSKIMIDDLMNIIDLLNSKNKTIEAVNASYYQKAIGVRDKYTENLKIFEKKFEDRPQHLKHILEDMVVTRQRIEPIVKRTVSLLSQFVTYENSFNATNGRANKVIEHVRNSVEICRLNCGHGNMENIITKTSSIQPSKDTQFYCGNIDEITKSITQSFIQFQTEYSQQLVNKIDTESEILQEEIINIKNKLKTAAVEQFGVTMYELLNLQDEYYHFFTDIKQYNISHVLQDVKQRDYEINSILVEFESMAKKYREYCNSCNHILVYTVSSPPKKTTIIDVNEPMSILDEVLHEVMKDIQTSIDTQYNNLFEELNRKLDAPMIIEAHLSKLKPIQGEVDSEIRKETEILEKMQSLVPKSSIENVLKLDNKSKELLRVIKEGLDFIKSHIKQI